MTDKNAHPIPFWRVVKSLRTLIDPRAGVLWGLIMGSIVLVINLAATTPPDYLGATTAALKQAIYTFFLGGFMTRIMAWLALRPGKTWQVLVPASLIPATFASILVYVMHSLRGTPSPLFSSIPTVLMCFAGFPILALRLRRKFLKK